MTRRIVTRHEMEEARNRGMAVADECRRLSEAIQKDGRQVSIEINGKSFYVLGAATCNEGRDPAVVICPNDGGVMVASAAVTVKGKVDAVWAAILKSAGVERHPFLDPDGGRILVPGGSA
jgi:Trm5-related predicted tRNA methylase